MIGSLSSAEYVNGEVVATLSNSLYLGYPNTVYAYGMANTISVPLPNLQTLLFRQSNAQVDVIGYRNNIIDTAFNIYAGEFCSYSNDWYLITGNNNGNNGIRLQSKVQNKTETAMMGESTNKVLSDIVDLLDKLYVFLIEVKLLYNTHTHPVSAGTTLPTEFLIIEEVPETTQVDTDKANIIRGTNLAGANYNPNASED